MRSSNFGVFVVLNALVPAVQENVSHTETNLQLSFQQQICLRMCDVLFYTKHVRVNVSNIKELEDFSINIKPRRYVVKLLNFRKELFNTRLTITQSSNFSAFVVPKISSINKPLLVAIKNISIQSECYEVF